VLDPPPRNRPGDGEYAGWLTAIYDRWTAQGRPVQIRTFDSILSPSQECGNWRMH